MNTLAKGWLRPVLLALALSIGLWASDEEICSKCLGGGPGATECSLSANGTDCSVTCGSGYACCAQDPVYPKCTCCGARVD